jgi:hypothetical protein
MKTFLTFALFSLALSSCTTREVSPTRDSRIAIDTIYQSKIINLQPELDSMCKLYMDSVYHYAVDSMLKERQDEMNKLVK